AAQYVVATPGGGRPPAIKKHGPRLAVEPGKPVGRVGVVGEGDQRAGWRHGQLLGERRLCNAEARRQKLSRATPRTILSSPNIKRTGSTKGRASCSRRVASMAASTASRQAKSWV